MPENTQESIYDLVIQTIAGITGLQQTDLSGRTTLLEDLALDSLAIFEIVIELEEKFCVRISDEDIDRIKTIDEIVDYIASRQAADSGRQA
jgi:acyl carrier protein